MGNRFNGDVPVNFPALTERMVDEMGVDRYMEEILRVADQQAMTDAGFVDFLLARGVSIEKARRMKRGTEDVTLHTGPHLGGFNRQISIPELIESVGTMAALCIYGRYCGENKRK